MAIRLEHEWWNLPDEGNVDAHGSVLRGALVAEEHANVGAAPLGVLLLAVEADLHSRKVTNGVCGYLVFGDS